jgi:N-methylhydantoinase A
VAERFRVASSPAIRLGVDIGGTFTDVALEVGDRRYTAKGLTTARAPEQGVLAMLRTVIAAAAITPGDVQLIIHGTTLATNALIERKGAKTALLTTEGFRDVVEIRHENRFENTTSISICRRRWYRAACACRSASASTRKAPY